MAIDIKGENGSQTAELAITDTGDTLCYDAFEQVAGGDPTTNSAQEWNRGLLTLTTIGAACTPALGAQPYIAVVTKHRNPVAAAVGFGVTSFVTLEIRQSSGHDAVAEHLTTIPEVLEAHTITGSGDLLCRIVARSNSDLQRVIDLIVSYQGIVRASTIIALSEQIPYRVLPLVESCVE